MGILNKLHRLIKPNQEHDLYKLHFCVHKEVFFNEYYLRGRFDYLNCNTGKWYTTYCDWHRCNSWEDLQIKYTNSLNTWSLSKKIIKKDLVKLIYALRGNIIYDERSILKILEDLNIH